MKSTESSVKSPLDNLILTYVCPVSWDSMEGDERERLCRQCSQKVYNIEDLTTKEAEALLAIQADKRACYRLFVRPDGTIKTDNCPRILRPVREKFRALKKTCSIALAMLFSITSVSGKSTPDRKTVKPIFPPNLAAVRGRYFGGIGGSVGTSNGLQMIKSKSLFDSTLTLNDSFLAQKELELKRKRHLDSKDYEELKEHFKKVGNSLGLFLVRDAQLKSMRSVYPSGLLPNEAIFELEKERQQVIAEYLEKAKSHLTEREYEQAILDVSWCLLAAINDRATGEYRLPEGVEKYIYLCNDKQSLIVMSEATRTELCKIISETAPVDINAKRQRELLLIGLSTARKN